MRAYEIACFIVCMVLITAVGCAFYQAFKHPEVFTAGQHCSCKENNDAFDAGGLTGMGVGWEQAAGIWPK